jgi:hypothetical protein
MYVDNSMSVAQVANGKPNLSTGWRLAFALENVKKELE